MREMRQNVLPEPGPATTRSGLVSALIAVRALRLTGQRAPQALSAQSVSAAGAGA